MNRRSLCLALCLFVEACSRPEPATHFTYLTAPELSMSRRVRSTYVVRNTSTTPLTGVSLWLYVPMERTSTQALKAVELSHPGVIQNGVGRIDFELPPLGVKILRADFELVQSPAPLALEADGQAFLSSRRLIEVDAPAIAAKAKSLRTDAPGTTAKAIYDFVSSHVKEGGYDVTDRGALYALQAERGDCSEFSSLFVALARGAGVPSRRVSGYYCASQCRNLTYHSWAEFHDGTRWVTVDAQNKKFSTEENAYLALELNEETAEAPLQGAHRYVVTGPGFRGEGGPVTVETQTQVD